MKNKTLSNKKTKDLIFCLLLIAVPMVQFCIFYLGVNINSFVMVFQEWTEIDSITGAGHYELVDNLFENFKRMFTYIEEGEGGFWIAMKNSGISFLVITLVGISFSLIFSLYIFKKGFGSGMFRVLLFAPSILSAAVTVTMYKYFVTGFSERIWGMGNGLLDSSAATEFGTVLFFNVWISFGTQVLMYSGAMNGIDPSVIEAAKLDGANPFREFFSIILPLIFPTIQTFLVTGIAALFVNQINLVAFSGLTADMKVKTVGYYLFTEGEFAMDIPDRMPILATFGVMLTLIAAPITLLSKWALDKFGPSVE